MFFMPFFFSLFAGWIGIVTLPLWEDYEERKSKGIIAISHLFPCLCFSGNWILPANIVFALGKSKIGF